MKTILSYITESKEHDKKIDEVTKEILSNINYNSLDSKEKGKIDVACDLNQIVKSEGDNEDKFYDYVEDHWDNFNMIERYKDAIRDELGYYDWEDIKKIYFTMSKYFKQIKHNPDHKIK